MSKRRRREAEAVSAAAMAALGACYVCPARARARAGVVCALATLAPRLPWKSRPPPLPRGACQRAHVLASLRASTYRND